MKPPDKKFPHANVAGQQPARPTPHARHLKPAFAQPKNAVTQTKSAVPAHASRHPAAPPVYRPQSKPPVAQRKAAVVTQPQTRTPPATPPTYRPQAAPKVLQTKRAVAAPTRTTRLEFKPPTPFGHRPQPAPGVLQAKKANEPRTPLAQRSGKLSLTAAPRPPQPASQNRQGTKPQGLSGSRTIQRAFDPINPHLDGLAALFAEPEEKQAELKMFAEFTAGSGEEPDAKRVDELGLWIAEVKRERKIKTDRFDRGFAEAKAKPALVKVGKLNEIIRTLNKFVPDVKAAPAPKAAPKSKAAEKQAGAAPAKKDVKEVKEAKPPLPPEIYFIKGLQSECFFYKEGGWKSHSRGTPRKEHAEKGLWLAMLKSRTGKGTSDRRWKGQRWVGFSQNGAPCVPCYEFFRDESVRQNEIVAGFVFHITGDQGGYRSASVYESVREKTTFGIYFINGVVTLQ